MVLSLCVLGPFAFTRLDEKSEKQDVVVPQELTAVSDQLIASSDKKEDDSKKDSDDVDYNEFAQQLSMLLQDPTFAAYLQQSGAQEGFLPSLSDLTNPEQQGHVSAMQQWKWSQLNFYEDYLKRYYPKVFVIREYFFERMSPDQIAKALEAIVDIFSDEPWFYFVDKRQGFNIAFYWEYILDQLSFISEFLKFARVDMRTQEVFLPEEKDYGCALGFLFGSSNKQMSKRRNTKNLFLYLKEQGETIIFYFYALCFDYLIKLFNEGILLKELNIVERCYTDLNFILKKLEDSVYEQDYQDVLRTCKELMERLRSRLGEDDLSMFEKYFGDDDEAMQMAKESIELGYM